MGKFRFPAVCAVFVALIACGLPWHLCAAFPEAEVSASQIQEILVRSRSTRARTESLLRLGKAAWKDGRLEEAVDHLQKARRLSPEDARTSFSLAHLRLAQGRYATAAGLLLEGMNYHPEWHRLNLDMASLFPSAHEFQQERDALLRYMQENPLASHERDVRFLLSYLLFFSGQRDACESLVRQTFWDGGQKIETNKMLAAIEHARKATQQRVEFRKPRAYHSQSMAAWYPTIEKLAKRYRMNPKFVAAVIHVESRFNPQAISPAGAQGMMQLIPATAARFGVRDPFDATQNIDGGIRYLRLLIEMFGDARLALAAYNAGEGNVLRYGGIPPFVETQGYVRDVLAIYRSL